jgi:high-affinity Fe2+/Pb2+ permease
MNKYPTNSSVFFVVFRESLEIVVVVSVLFAFLKQTLGNEPVVFRKLCKQVPPYLPNPLHLSPP